MAKAPVGVGPKYPQVDVVRRHGRSRARKLCRAVSSLHRRLHSRVPHHRRLARPLDAEGFRDDRARGALEVSTARRARTAWRAFAPMLDYVPMAAGAGALQGRSRGPSRRFGGESQPRCITSACRRTRRWRRCACFPRPASSSVRASSWRSRSAPISPARVDAQRQAARGLRRGSDLPHRPFPRQGAGAEHSRLPFRQRPVRADLEPQFHRPRADRRAGDARARQARRHSTSRPAPIATWW